MEKSCIFNRYQFLYIFFQSTYRFYLFSCPQKGRICSNHGENLYIDIDIIDIPFLYISILCQKKKLILQWSTYLFYLFPVHKKAEFVWTIEKSCIPNRYTIAVHIHLMPKEETYSAMVNISVLSVSCPQKGRICLNHGEKLHL